MQATMATAATQQQTAPRQFARFQLLRMLGRSLASAVWLAMDPRLQQEVLVVVPRAQPANVRERENWMADVQAGARLRHPRLSEVLEVGLHEGWPFVTYARGSGMTLAERVSTGSSLTPVESVQIIAEVLEGVAYAHEAGVAHHDIGLHDVLLDANGHAQLLGLGAGLARLAPGDARAQHMGRQELRLASERDVLMCGLLLHRLLANHPALDDADIGSAAGRVGVEIVRLPWTTPHPVPETLRAIVNRSTDRQHRQRYLNARTLLGALHGWIKTNADEAGGPLALLLDRLNSVGTLPSRPGMERALVGALSQEMLRVDDFVDVLVMNPALTWEMLRAVNTASFRSQGVDEAVSTLSRAVMLLGQQGIRKVASTVRAWPGALGAQASLTHTGETPAVVALQHELRRTCLAGAMARLLAPFTIHDEEASVSAMSQRLGRLLIHYHFPDEAAQIHRLMQPSPATEPDAKPTPGMQLETAVSAVLGVNLDDLGGAVLQHWGMHERIVHAGRPLPRTTPVRHPSSPEETLRAVASLANELTDALQMEPTKVPSAIHQAYLRYARALELSSKECLQTIEQATRLVDGGRKPEALNPT